MDMQEIEPGIAVEPETADEINQTLVSFPDANINDVRPGDVLVFRDHKGDLYLIRIYDHNGLSFDVFNENGQSVGDITENADLSELATSYVNDWVREHGPERVINDLGPEIITGLLQKYSDFDDDVAMMLILSLASDMDVEDILDLVRKNII